MALLPLTTYLAWMAHFIWTKTACLGLFIVEGPKEFPEITFKPLKNAIQEYDERMQRLERANPDTFRVERRCLDPDTRVLTADLTALVGSDYTATNLTLRTSGGRVLCVTALADSIRRAQQAAYDAVNQTQFEGRQFRRDIGWRALAAGKRHD